VRVCQFRHLGTVDSNYSPTPGRLSIDTLSSRGITPAVATSLSCRFLALSGALLACAVAAPARASLLPPADFDPDGRLIGLGLGYGGGVSLDWGIGKGLMVGVSAARLVAPAGNRLDARILYQFVSGNGKGLSISGILGLWADTGFAGSPFPFLPPVEGGFGLAYPVMPRLNARLNLVVPLFAPQRAFDVFGGPAAGLEVGYAFRPGMEATLGLNGQGNLLGLRLGF